MGIVYNGTITSGNEPNIWVEFSFPYTPDYVFGDKEMVLTQTDANHISLENGYRGDARAEIDYGSGVAHIDFGKLPAGTYTPDTPFLHLRLDFEKILADLDGHDMVNLKDYAITVQYWGKEGRSIADILGPNDVPDMIVDAYDLAKLAEQWLYRIEDGNIVSKVESVIRSIIEQREYKQSQIAKILYGDETQNQKKPSLKQLLALSPNGRNHSSPAKRQTVVDKRIPHQFGLPLPGVARFFA